MNHLDLYKACIIGINQQTLAGAQRKSLTTEQLFERKKAASNVPQTETQKSQIEAEPLIKL
jgi:hypothetical protein